MRLNKVLLQGRLGAEPEIVSLKDGGRAANFSIAVDAGYRGADGEWRDAVDWIRITTLRGKLVEKLAAAGPLKGRQVLVDGRLRSRRYVKDGETRYGVEVRVGAFGAIDLLDATADRERTPTPEKGIGNE